MSSLTNLTLKAALDGLKAKAFSSEEITRAHMAAIEKANPRLNAFVLPTFDHAVAMAKASDAKLAKGEGGPLEGAPLGVKDLFATQGHRTTAGSKILGNFIPQYESTVSAHLWRDGAVMLGKTEHGRVRHGLVQRRTSAWGPVVNPWEVEDLQRGTDARRFVRRFGKRGCGGAVPGRDGVGHRRFDPPARGLHRQGRFQAHLRSLFALGHRGVRLLARPGGPDRQDRGRPRDPAAIRWPGYDAEGFHQH